MSKAYKLFRIKKDGRIYPLYVLSNKPTPIGVWVKAESGERIGDRVKSKLGLLKLRSGWHLSDKVPHVDHIGVKENGIVKYMHADTVWAEVEYSDEIDYTPVVYKKGMKNGKFDPKLACMEDVPVNGFYRYKTSPLQKEPWIISGAIKVVKILTDEEVAEICKMNGYEPQPRLAT